MTTPYRLAATVCRSGALGSAAALGVLGGQTWLARTRIPMASTAPPVTHDTVWRARRASTAQNCLQLALLGDSMAAGYGVDEPRDTLAAGLALRLSAALRRPVRISNHARVGARSRDLHAQLAQLALGPGPDLAVVVVGANDVTHRVRVTEAVRHLSYAAHRLRLMDAAVVVGTCPDLGTVRPIAEPLRTVAQRMGHALAAAQSDAVRRAGGVPVPMAQLLGDRFRADPAMFAADRYHPSACGYAAAADALFPAALAALAALQPVASLVVPDAA